MTGTPGTSGPETISGRGESAQFVDLQVHSTASDGALSPTKVVEAARDAQLYAIALTDHDTVDGVAEAIAAGVECGVRIIAGVELSAHFDDDELHLLGLHLSNQDAMRSALLELQAGRVARAVRIVEVLNRHSIPVTMDAVLVEANAERSVDRTLPAQWSLVDGCGIFARPLIGGSASVAPRTWRKNASMSPTPSHSCMKPADSPCGRISVAPTSKESWIAYGGQSRVFEGLTGLMRSLASG